MAVSANSSYQPSSSKPLGNYATQGWGVAVACFAGITLGSTQLAPVVLGILTLALLYQTSQLLQGK